MQRSTIDIPVHERHCLTIAEAAAYFLIGQDKLREIIANDAVNTDGVCASDCVLVKRSESKENYLKIGLIRSIFFNQFNKER